MAPIARLGRHALVRRAAGLTGTLGAALLALVVTAPMTARAVDGLVSPAAAAPLLGRGPVTLDLAAARQAILELRRADAGLAHFFDGSAGYAVFATVRRGAPGAGGTDGLGILFADGLPVGSVQLTEEAASSGPGPRTFTEVLFFETRQALATFEGGTFTLGVRVVSVDAAARTSASATYQSGASVFTLGWTGPAGAEAVGGQRFSYLPFQPMLAASDR